MNKAIITVGLIAASLLVAPKFIGNIVEQEREKTIVELNKSDDITLTTTEYNSGWFGANVTSELTFNVEGDDLAEVTIALEEAMSFGPVMFTEQGLQLGLGYSAMKFKLLSADVDEDITKLLNEKVHIGALLGFNKDVTAFIATDEIRYEEGGSSLVSAPSSAQFSFIDNDEISGDFSWQGLEMNNSNERFVMGKVTMTTQQKVARGDYLAGTAILTGDANFKIANVSMTDENNTIFSLNDAELNSVVSLANEFLTVDVSYHAKDIAASGQSFEQPNLDLVLEKIDINALQELNTAMADIANNSSAQGGFDDAQSEEVLAVLADVTEKILAKNPKLKVTDLSVVTEQGKITSKFNFALNKDLIDSSKLNAMTIAMALEADAKGEIPLAFLETFGVSPMVEAFVEQGYFTKQDNNLNFDAKYSETQLMLNGKVFQM
ncbi:DUF945 family protein [Colwellia sp. E2M01]|uniref:YdgA family protein n=1 Tax=Colwellia sp. E2M01 TaxID=2841561 RepID=UPI001C08BA98|nr:DUF945 family protein [Colwellia sp. E2M01]MBU2870343.1 YdgA family protein [Colwellia sp. E2M01]